MNQTEEFKQKLVKNHEEMKRQQTNNEVTCMVTIPEPNFKNKPTTSQQQASNDLETKQRLLRNHGK